MLWVKIIDAEIWKSGLEFKLYRYIIKKILQSLIYKRELITQSSEFSEIMWKQMLFSVVFKMILKFYIHKYILGFCVY